MKRERNLSRELNKLFESDGAPIEGIYLSLDGAETTELAPSEAYRMSLVVVAKSLALDAETERQGIADVLASKIRHLFECANWAHDAGTVDLVRCVATTERMFSVFQASRMLRWHLDWLSDDSELQ